MHIEICLSCRVLGSVIDFIHRCRCRNRYWFCPRLSWPPLATPLPALMPCILSLRQFMSFVCHFWRSLSLPTHTNTPTHTPTHTSAQSRIARRAAHPSHVSTVTVVVVFLGFSLPLAALLLPLPRLSSYALPSVLTVIACQGAVEFYYPDSCFFLCCSLPGDPVLNHSILSSTCSVRAALKATIC